MQVGMKMQNEFYQVYRPFIGPVTAKPQRVKNSRRMAPLMGVCVATMGLYAAQGTDIKFTPGSRGEERTITFSWSKPVDFTQRVTGDELVLRFPDEIKFVNEKAMAQAAKNTGDSINYGYDSLVFKHGPDESMRVEKGAHGVTLHITKNPVNESRDEDTDPIAVQLIAARIALEKGNFKKTFEILDPLSAAHPGNVLILQARAGAEFSAGRWEMAHKHIEEAKKIAPLNEDVQLIERAIEDEYGPYASADTEYRHTGKIRKETFGRGHVRVKVAEGLFFGANSDTNHMKAKGITRSRTGIVGNYTVTKTRGDAYMEFNSNAGHQFRGTLYGSKSPGGGAEAHYNDLQGYYILQGDYHRPTWDYAEGVIDHAVLDRVIIGRRHVFNPHIFAEVRGGLNRYGIDGTRRTGDSVTLNGILSYTFAAPTMEKYLGRTGELTLVYNVDGEYVHHVKEKIGVQGNVYKPLPMVNREVHGAEIAFTADLAKTVNNYGYVGYSVDRYGGNGPRAGYRLTYKPTTHIRAIAEVGTSLGSGGSSKQREDHAKAELKWVF